MKESQNIEITIPNTYGNINSDLHREFGCEITEGQFCGAGNTLPYIITAQNFNKRCKRNY